MTKKHHAIMADGVTGSDDDLLDTKQMAEWLGRSTQWLEIGRSKTDTGGYGPPFIRISQRCVRYRRGDVKDWLHSRTTVGV